MTDLKEMVRRPGRELVACTMALLIYWLFGCSKGVEERRKSEGKLCLSLLINHPTTATSWLAYGDVKTRMHRDTVDKFVR